MTPPALSYRHFAKTRGAILIEVMLSLLIFSIGIIAALALLVHSTTANTMNKNRTIAASLAREGIEVVKNIRDTNWLVSSANLRACWNFSPDTEEDGDMTNNVPCTPDTFGQNNHPLGTIGSGASRVRMRSFLADFDPATARWMLLPAPQYFDSGSMTFLNYSLGVPNGEATSVSATAGRTLQLYITPEGKYTHLAAGNTPSEFYRTIEISYFDNSGSGQDGLFPNGADLATGEAAWRDNRIKIISRVYWKTSPASERYSNVTLETILTDYLNRTNWTD